MLVTNKRITADTRLLFNAFSLIALTDIRSISGRYQLPLTLHDASHQTLDGFSLQRRGNKKNLSISGTAFPVSFLPWRFVLMAFAQSSVIKEKWTSNAVLLIELMVIIDIVPF